MTSNITCWCWGQEKLCTPDFHNGVIEWIKCRIFKSITFHHFPMITIDIPLLPRFHDDEVESVCSSAVKTVIDSDCISARKWMVMICQWYVMMAHDGPWWPMMALYPGCGTHWNAVCRFVQLHSSLVTCFEAQSTYQEHPRWGSRSPLAPVESSWMLSMNNLICVNHVNLQCAQLWLISTSGCGYTMGTLRQADHRIDWNWAHRSHHFKVPTTLPYPGALAARKS